MLSFRLGKIPVQVHFTHVLFALWFGSGWSPANFGSSWLSAELSDASSAGHTNARILWTALVALMVFVSILVHELGHATVSLAFGYKPDIQLAWIGGRTAPNANETIPWFKNLALTAAGPLFGLGLALVSIIIAIAAPDPSPPDAIFKTLAALNIFWGIVNLLPIYPLDGGQIVETLFRRVWGRPGFLYAQVLTLLTLGAAVILMGRVSGMSQLNVLLAILLGMRSVFAIQQYMRGEAPAEPNHPSEVAYREAVKLFEENKLQQSARLAAEALTLDMTPNLRARYHHLLGWIAVKDGAGRAALDHFAQVQGVPVEPQALAAAFSLIGDETRALPLWEQAWRSTQDPTVMHEYAGSLIRAGRDDDARRVPGVEMATAYRCAERLLFMRGDYAAAAQAGLKGLDLRPSANAAYDVACAFARARDREQAVAVLRRAMELGFRDADYASTDSDLESLHGYRPFTELLDALRQNRNG